jgi:hypothetical protein
MSLWVHFAGWLLVLINSLCLLRLGILPMVFFGRNYVLYRKIFWVSLFITLVFLCSEVMLITITLNLELN